MKEQKSIRCCVNETILIINTIQCNSMQRVRRCRTVTPLVSPAVTAVSPPTWVRGADCFHLLYSPCLLSSFPSLMHSENCINPETLLPFYRTVLFQSTKPTLLGTTKVFSHVSYQIDWNVSLTIPMPILHPLSTIKVCTTLKGMIATLGRNYQAS